MAFEYYMNMERIALDIAKEHVENMTDDNMEDDVFLDENEIANNIARKIKPKDEINKDKNNRKKYDTRF